MAPSPIIDHLANVKEKLGEEAWKKEVQRLARAALLMGPRHEAVWRDLTKGDEYAWLDWAQLTKEAAAEATSGADTNQLLLSAIRQQMPGLKTQAQFNAFMAAFDAFRLTLNSVFEGNVEKAAAGRKALDMAFDVAAQVTDISNQLADVPEAATSKSAEEFKTPPIQFEEYETQRRLLAELEAAKTSNALTAWYEETTERRNRIVSQTLRHSLMDAIRHRKLDLQSKGL